MAQTTPPVIIIKKKGGHGGHHGGAWKVAYADFVTAMMALFIVLWLLSSSEETKKAVGGYFQDPTGRGKLVGTSQFGSGESLFISKTEMEKLKEKIESAMRTLPEFQKLKNQVRITITAEGLRIELLETAKGLFFESGSAEPSAMGKELLTNLAKELRKFPNRIIIEGHTDSAPYLGKAIYSNWELSADRANSARRWMQEQGLREDQVLEVRGFADQSLFKPTNPADPSNRRISVIIHYSQPGATDALLKAANSAARSILPGSSTPTTGALDSRANPKAVGSHTK
jgi:chemotaxis protein MotB